MLWFYAQGSYNKGTYTMPRGTARHQWSAVNRGTHTMLLLLSSLQLATPSCVSPLTDLSAASCTAETWADMHAAYK